MVSDLERARILHYAPRTRIWHEIRERDSGSPPEKFVFLRKGESTNPTLVAPRDHKLDFDTLIEIYKSSLNRQVSKGTQTVSGISPVRLTPRLNCNWQKGAGIPCPTLTEYLNNIVKILSNRLKRGLILFWF